MAHSGHSGGSPGPLATHTGGHVQAMSFMQRPCKARAMNGGEGLLIVIAVVVGGAVVTYAIVRMSDRW